MKRFFSIVISMAMVWAFYSYAFSFQIMPIKAIAVTLSETQIINALYSRLGEYYEEDMCLQFVDEFWQSMGGIRTNDCCAYISGNKYVTSNSIDNIPIGANVYFYHNFPDIIDSCGNIPGHIGIYVGNGKMIDAAKGHIREVPISYFNHDDWEYRGWGYHPGVTIANCNTQNPNEGAGQTIPDGTYWIGSKLQSDYILDIPGSEPVTSECNIALHIFGNAVFEKYDAWDIQYLNNGFYKISQHTTSMCLDVDDIGNVRLCPDNNSASQMWSIEKNQTGFQLISKLNNHALTVENAKTENETNAITWAKDGDKNKNWTLIPYTENITKQTIPNGTYWIGSKLQNDYIIDIPGSEPMTSESNISLHIFGGAVFEKYDAWDIRYLNNGFYKISQHTTSMCLDVDDTAFKDFANVKLCPDSNEISQMWAIEKSETGFQIVSRLNNHVLTVENAQIEDETNVCTWIKNSAPNKNWDLISYFVKGDCNNDDNVTIADAVILQKYLLNTETTLPNWKAADLNEDGLLDVFDLILLKKAVLSE